MPFNQKEFFNAIFNYDLDTLQAQLKDARGDEVNALLPAGITGTLEPFMGKTALHILFFSLKTLDPSSEETRKQIMACLSALLAHTRINPNKPSKDGETPLEIEACHEFNDGFDLLINHKSIDLNKLNKKNRHIILRKILKAELTSTVISQRIERLINKGLQIHWEDILYIEKKFSAEKPKITPAVQLLIVQTYQDQQKVIVSSRTPLYVILLLLVGIIGLSLVGTGLSAFFGLLILAPWLTFTLLASGSIVSLGSFIAALIVKSSTTPNNPKLTSQKLSFSKEEFVKAIKDSNPVKLFVQLQAGTSADVNTIIEGKGPILHWACKISTHFNAGNITDNFPLECIKLLLADPKMDVNQKHDGQSILHAAVDNIWQGRVTENCIRLIELLLTCERLAVNAPDNNGNTALHLSELDEHARVYFPLLLNQSGINPNIKNSNLGNTVLHTTILYNYVEGIDHLINFPGIDVNVPNNKGETPLRMLVKLADKADLIKALVEKGVSVTESDIKAAKDEYKELLKEHYKQQNPTQAALGNSAEFKRILDNPTYNTKGTGTRIPLKYTQ